MENANEICLESCPSLCLSLSLSLSFSSEVRKQRRFQCHGRLLLRVYPLSEALYEEYNDIPSRSTGMLA